MDIEIYAAQLEAGQADRDFSEAYEALRAAGSPMGSREDYAMWSAAGYADAAHRAIPSPPKIPSNTHFIRMKDGVKGKRHASRRLFVEGK